MGDTAFYSAAAQVIPLLLLALLFEARALSRRDQSPSPQSAAFASALIMLLILAVVVPAVGTAAALHAVGTGDPSHIDKLLVVLSVVALLMMLTMRVALDFLRHNEPLLPRYLTAHAQAIATVATVIVACSAGALLVGMPV